MKNFNFRTLVLILAPLLASAGEADASAKTYVCQRDDSPSQIVSFHVSGLGIQFYEWKSALGLCQMTTDNVLPLLRADKKNSETPKTKLQGFTYKTEFDWYYTATYYLTFQQPIAQHKVGSVIKMEMNGDDADGCRFSHDQFTCVVD